MILAYKIVKESVFCFLNEDLVGRIFVQHPYTEHWHIAATPTSPTIYGWGSNGIWNMSLMNIVEPVDLKVMEKIHPHLLKYVREELTKAP